MNDEKQKSDYTSKEDELMRINQQLDEQRKALQQDYVGINYIKKQFKELYGKNDKVQYEDVMDDPRFDNYNPDNSDEDEYNEENEDFENADSNLNAERKQLTSESDESPDDKQEIWEGRNAERVENPKKEILELELLVDEEKKMIRLQKLKLEAIQSELEKKRHTNRQKELVATEIEQKGRSIIDQTKKYNAQINQLNEKTEILKQNYLELQTKQKTIEKETAAIVKEIENLKKEYRRFDVEANKKELAINRIVEQIQKLKLSQQQQKLTSNVKRNDYQENVEQLERENQKIEQSIAEAFIALKKQLKLIDVLKRQRIHIIAARFFSFIEADFQSAMDSGQKLMKQI